MEEFKIIELTKDRYNEWDRFCMASDDAWFYHTVDWFEYSCALRPHLKSKQCSFMIIKGEEIFVICPLIAELNEDGMRQFSFGGLPVPFPAVRNDLSKEKREKILHLAFEHIDELSLEFKISRAIFQITPLAPSFLKGFNKYNYLIKYGYLDTSLATQVIDISLDLKTLMAELSKGHNYGIDRGRKELEVEVYTKENITRDIFDGYRLLHHKSAGRVTRPLETFDMMYKWIIEGNAFLVSAKKEGSPIAYSLLADYKGNAYYGSSCMELDLRDSKMPIGHIIQWMTIEWLKNTNHKLYEIGWQQFGPLLHNFPSQKEINIAHFKRGFGGYTVPLFTGEKYYSRDYFDKVYSERLKNYAATIKEAQLNG